MAEKEKEKAEKSTEKLVLFNHSKNPFHLGKNEDGTERWFRIGDSIECKSPEEYKFLKNYKGVSTTKQVAPTLATHIQSLNDTIAAKEQENADLKAQLAKFQAKGK